MIMLNAFQAEFWEFDDPDWQAATFTPDQADVQIEVFLFTTYLPVNWQVWSSWEPFDTPYVGNNERRIEPRAWNLLTMAGNNILVAGNPTDPVAVREQVYGATITNGLDVRGFYGLVEVADKTYLVAPDPVGCTLQMAVQCDGGTVRGPQNGTQVVADTAPPTTLDYQPILIPETQYTAAIQGDLDGSTPNQFQVVAGPLTVTFEVVGLYFEIP